MSTSNPGSNVAFKKYEIRFFKVQTYVLPALEITSQPNLPLDVLEVKFDVEGVTDDWRKFLEKAYVNELQNPQNPQFDPYASSSVGNPDPTLNRKVVLPQFDRKNAGKLPKLNKTRKIQINAMLLDATGDFAAKCKSPRIELPEEYLFKTAYTLEIDPKRWKIFLNYGKKGEKTSGTPISISVKEIVEGATDPFLDLDYRKEDLDQLSRKLNLVSLDEQFKKLREAIRGARSVETRDDDALRRWTYALEDFTFTFQPNETSMLRQEYLQGKPVLIRTRLTCADAESIPLEIEILPHDKLCVETLAVDFGSSVSTACFYSPSFAQTIDGAGLPVEQLRELRKELARWFESPRSSELEDYWFRFILNVARELGDYEQKNNKLALQRILEVIDGRDEDEFYRCWLAIENSLAGVPDDRPLHAQATFQSELYEIYRNVFSRFPFDRRCIKTAELENKQGQIVSEFCIDSAPNAPWPEGKMGQAVADERRRRELQDKSTEQYFRNPKSKIYEINKNITSSDEKYSPRQIFQGALDTLVTKARNELSNRFLQTKGTREGIPYLILTYPVTLSAQARRQLVNTARQLGFPRVKIVDRYDESTAPAIFYLDKYFGNFDELGPEAFKMKCSYGEGVWRHNMLIVDVGAGTTDISIVQVEIREKFDGEPHGRVYEIVPTLLGALGYEQVGGNLLTLYVFHFLKILLARFFAKSKEGSDLSALPKKIDDIKLSFNDFYDRDESFPFENATEQYVSTYTKDQEGNRITNPDYAERVNRFAWLWQWAEKVKIAFSERRKREEEGGAKYPDLDLFEGAPEFGLKGLKHEIENPQSEFVRAFLGGYFGSGGEKDKFTDFVKRHRGDLVFPNRKFDELATDFVKKIVLRASEVTIKALETRLKILQKKFGVQPSITEACQGVHSVVLSGRASKLPQVKKAFEKEINDSCFLRRNNGIPFARTRTRIVFEDEYAKTATVVGASRAEEIRQSEYLDIKNNPYVQAGRCYRYLDVDNLTHNLPSSFSSGDWMIFELQTQYELCDFDGGERVRNFGGFVTPQHAVHIRRHIGDQTTNHQGATLDVDVLNAGLDEQIDFRDFRVAYEIDPELNVYALIKKRQNATIWDLRRTPNQYRLRIDRKLAEKIVIKNGDVFELNYEICVRNLSNDETTVFSKGTRFTETCVVTPADVNEGEIKKIPFIKTSSDLKVQDVVQRSLTFYVREGRNMRGLGTINLTPEPCDMRPWENSLRVALTSEGEFVLFVGSEPDYWETRDAREWNHNFDMILRKDITNGNSDVFNSLDPFNGRQ